MRIATNTATPRPVPDERSQGFWDFAAAHVLAMQECGSCGWLAYPPANYCANCLADAAEFAWRPVSGRGQVKTWTVMRQAFLPGFDAEVPYVVGDIELVEQSGLRMAARIMRIEASELRLSLAVEVAFTDVDEGLAIPHFVPVQQ